MTKKKLPIIISISAVLLIAVIYFIFLKQATVFVAFHDQENGYALFVPNSFTEQTAAANQVLLLSEKPQASINIMMGSGRV